jgi:hypothetical protein
VEGKDEGRTNNINNPYRDDTHPFGIIGEPLADGCVMVDGGSLDKFFGMVSVLCSRLRWFINDSNESIQDGQ